MIDQVLIEIKKEFERRMIEESLSRIKRCLDILSLEEVWYRKNENTNSVGNLILHLSGNVQQYIGFGIGGLQDKRKRNDKFESRENIQKDRLYEKIKETVETANGIIQKLTIEELVLDRKVQGFSENTISVIIHVIEHFSYHVGQITFYTKYIKDENTGYYSGQNLDITSD